MSPPAVFLSTLPARGATGGRLRFCREVRHFYPRSPRGERLSICTFVAYLIEPFLSTLPARGATMIRRYPELCRRISIHAPREGSDATLAPSRGTARNFYPRSPRGERLPASPSARAATSFLSTLPARGATSARPNSSATLGRFLSTLPARGATASQREGRLRELISIHAPREGSDPS